MTTNEASRQDRIATAQRAYSAADLSGARSDWDDYNALVQFVAWDHEISLEDAFRLVLDGPVIY
jgi:hypothetical protein